MSGTCKYNEVLPLAKDSLAESHVWHLERENGKKWRYDIQHDDIQLNDTQHNGRALLCWVSFMLTVTYAECHYAECRYAECRCAEKITK